MLDIVSSQAAPGRLPPHNLEAERSVLGAVLIKPSAFDEVATTLQVDDFFLPAHREIFEAMLAIDKRQQPLDVIAVADELRVRGMIARLDGGEMYLLTLSNSVPTAENIGHYARLAPKFSQGPMAISETSRNSWTRLKPRCSRSLSKTDVKATRR